MFHFKAYGMINLQYEIIICQKSHNKVTKTVYVWFKFLSIRRYLIFWKLLWYYRLFDFSSSKPRNSRTEFSLLLGTSRLFDEISGCIKVFPTFKEFIQYVIEKPTNHDPHWMTYNKVLVKHST